MTPLDAMKQALEALYMSRPAYIKNALDKHEAAIAALSAAIEQYEAAEPVAWMSESGSTLTDEEATSLPWKKERHYIPLYTHPAPAVPEDKYNELIMAVGNKYPNETRHQTALRYIRMAENNANSMLPKSAAPEYKEQV